MTMDLVRCFCGPEAAERADPGLRFRRASLIARISFALFCSDEGGGYWVGCECVVLLASALDLFNPSSCGRSDSVELFCLISLRSVAAVKAENLACCSATCAERSSSLYSHDGKLSVRCVKDVRASIVTLDNGRMKSMREYEDRTRPAYIS